MCEVLLNHIKKYIALTKEEEFFIASCFTGKEVKKKEHILVSGQKCQHHYFIVRGMCRMYLLTHQGKEQTIQFGLENWWLTDYETYGCQTHTSFNIQALENTEILEIAYEKQEELLNKIPKLEKYFRIILQRAYAASLTRINLIFTLSKEEKYYHFRDQFPEFVQRVPQKILSSYLGFTPEYLSEIRKKKN